MIKSFRHKGLERFFREGSQAGIQAATGPDDMNKPGWRLHALSGNLAAHWSVWVNSNWRTTFLFEGEDAVLVDYQDYH